MFSLTDNPLRRLNAAGQSVWYDHIHRALLNSGELNHLIQRDDLRGVTSNPSLFDNAITGGHDYDGSLQHEIERQTGHGGEPSSRQLFYALAIEDICVAADLLAPVYEATAGLDGMVSLEVSPDLAHNAEATIREAKLLHARVNRPNLMIKIPGTQAGLLAIEKLTGEGINVNVTLLFSVDRYLQVVEAYLCGLEERLSKNQSVDWVASVASFFVSRLDGLLDPMLAQIAPKLQGKIAIANAKMAYQRFQEVYSSARFAKLSAAGAWPQRLLWASTSTKNPDYRDVLYVEALIGPNTVNTLPPVTYAAFRDHGVVAPTLEQGLETALTQLASLPELGIDLEAATTRLEKEGIAAFAKSFDNLMCHIAAKARALTNIV
jgi:transaldolase/transaldolase/glucose-6-phosphate isomerase